MIRYHHNERIAVATREIECNAARLVESQIIGQHAHRIVAVRRPVYFTSFYHQEEAVFVLREFV